LKRNMHDMNYFAINSTKRPAVKIAAALLWLPLAAAAQEGGYFSGVRLGASEKAWSFAAPGLKLGQALEFSRAGETVTTAFSGYQFASGFAVGAAVNTESATLLSGSSVGLKVSGSRWSEPR
jgi:hypothetical protein